MTKEQILKKYYDTVGSDSAKARQLIRKLDYGSDPYLLSCIGQTYFDESLFDKNGEYRTHFDNRKLRLAEKYGLRAYKINPDHSEVLWIMGKIRNAFKQTDLAIYCFKTIIARGVKRVVNDVDDNDIKYAQMKINDSKFQLYRLYYDIGNLGLSKRYLAMYKNGLKKGIKTVYKPLNKFVMDNSDLSTLKAFPLHSKI
jgi:hypothetical protein